MERIKSGKVTITDLILPEYASIFITLGKPGSGKSYAIEGFIRAYVNAGFFKFGTVFTGAGFSHEFKYLPEKIVFKDYSEDKLMKYITYLQKREENEPDMNPKDKYWPENTKLPPNFIIFDDLLGLANFYTAKIEHWLSVYRKTNTFIFFTSQYIASRATSTMLREFANYIFLWRARSGNSIEGLYDSFGRYANRSSEKIFTNVDEFNDVLAEATSEPHRCLLLINERGASEDPKFVFWKSDEIPKDAKPLFDSKASKSEEKKA